MYKIIIAFFLVCSLSQAKTSYIKGEMVNVESCDKFQWCKVDGYYLKGFKLKFIKNNQYEVKYEKIYTYQKNSVLRDKYPEFTKVYYYVTNNEFHNYIASYTSLDLFNVDRNFYDMAYNEKRQVAKVTNVADIKNIKKEVVVTKESSVTNVADIKNIKKEVIVTKESSDFVSLFVGKSTLGILQNDYTSTPTVNNQALDDSAFFIDLAVGTYIQKNIFTQIGLSQTKLDLSTILDLSAELNYEFETSLQPYVGLSIGISKLKWKDTPLGVTTSDNDFTANSYSYGLQAGMKYKIMKNISALLKYKHIKYSSVKTRIEPSGYNSEILYENANQFAIGIQYGF